MPKFIVKIVVTKEEFWEIEAPDASEAANNYNEGRLFDCTDEECQIVSVYPKAA